MSDCTSLRRAFLKAGARAATAAALPIARGGHAAGSDVLRVGLVGCGSGEAGAAVNALNADANARLTAMADLFPENIRDSRQSLRQLKGGQVAVDDDHCFGGFDGYRKLLASGVDVVLLALPTFFHPSYLKACVEAGKHVFCEKFTRSMPPGCGPFWRPPKRPARKG